MKKSGILLMTALFGMLLVMVSCGGDKPTYTEGQELTLSGKIKVVENDGIAYALVTDQNEFFEIINPEEKYQTDGTPIKARVQIVKLVTLARVGPACKVIQYLE